MPPRIQQSDLVKVIFNVVDKAWKETQVGIAEQYGPQIVDDIRARIHGQRFDHEPLSPEYKRWKEKHGYDSRTLIQTAQYVNNIRWWKLPNGSLVVGVPRNVYHHSGLPLVVLAQIHEFGAPAAGIPARPTWRPVMRYWKRRLPEEFARQFKWNLARQRRIQIG